MLADLFKGPKVVSSRTQGLPTRPCAHPPGTPLPLISLAGVWRRLLLDPLVWRRSFVLPLAPHSFCPGGGCSRGAVCFLGSPRRGWGIFEGTGKRDLEQSPGQSAEEATDVMTPLKQECASQVARPCQRVAHRGPLSPGRAEPQGAALAHPKVVFCACTC